ncbi:MAG TPA: hypothetical protein VF916_14110 [Ktedonobacterales bacterium]
MQEQVKAAYDDGASGFAFDEGASVEAAWQPEQHRTRWVRVIITQRTLIVTPAGHWHAVYMVRDARRAEWIAGEGELRDPMERS